MAKAKEQQTPISITEPNLRILPLKIVGTSPLVMNAFPEKAKEQMRAAQEAGSVGKKGKKREPKDFDACYQGAMHKTAGGQIGIPAMAFKAAAVRACALPSVNFHMTKAKCAIFICADVMSTDGTPLVLIRKGEPKMDVRAVRNETGVADLRARPMWREGWEATVRVRFDADVFSPTDIANLMMRAGLQVGILEGRAFSSQSVGMGWGEFEIKEDVA